MSNSAAVAKAPTSAQRRLLEAARRIIVADAGLYAAATGRAHARWSAGATWIVGIFSAVFLLAIVFLHLVLFPGVLVIALLYETVRPRRGIVVTAAGLAELHLRITDARPTAVIATTDHAALFAPRLGRGTDSKAAIPFGGELVSVRERDLQLLRAAVPAFAMRSEGTAIGLPLPPPPPLALTPRSERWIPSWREPTLLWVIVHILMSLFLFIAVTQFAIATATLFGRQTEHTTSVAYTTFWIVLLATSAGWMLFVYLRRSFRTRARILGLCLAGSYLVAAVAIYVYSPPVPHLVGLP